MDAQDFRDQVGLVQFKQSFQHVLPALSIRNRLLQCTVPLTVECIERNPKVHQCDFLVLIGPNRFSMLQPGASPMETHIGRMPRIDKRKPSFMWLPKSPQQMK